MLHDVEDSNESNVSNDSDDIHNYYHCAHFYLDSHEYKEAIDHCDLYLGKYPDNEQILKVRSQARILLSIQNSISHRKFNEAREKAEKILKDIPEHPVARQYLKHANLCEEIVERKKALVSRESFWGEKRSCVEVDLNATRGSNKTKRIKL